MDRERSVADPHKSWKKINEERKALKRQRKQDKLIKQLEKEKTDKVAKDSTNGGSDEVEKLTNLQLSTVSIAVPGSILENAQSAELRTYVAGQIARAAAIFRVNEIIVFDDVGIATAKETKRDYAAELNDDDDPNCPNATPKTVRASSLQLARILQYLECPQYLRKFFFPLHKDLKYSGLLNPLDTPHHLRQQNVFLYREGVVSEKKAKEGHSYVNVGLLNDVLVNKAIEAGVRVTIKIENKGESMKKLRGKVVSPDEPRRETGVYWGYAVRIAHSLAELFTKSPYKGGYDLTIGTSDRGESVHGLEAKSLQYNHLLIVFGGLAGLEAALANDDDLNVDDPALLFDHYLNVLPKQGSRTIRTEEALLIAMAALQEKIEPKFPELESNEFKELLPKSEDTSHLENTFGNPFSSSKRNHEKAKRRKLNESAEMEDHTVADATIENSFQGESKAKDLSESNGSGAGGDDASNDFEVVPTSIGINNKNKNVESEDLSRFD